MLLVLRLLIVVISVSVAVPAIAVAQDDRSNELIEEALALRGDGDDPGALPLLEEAHALNPTPRSAAQVGLVQQALGNWVSAVMHLREALAAEDSVWIRRNRRALQEALEFVETRVGYLELEISVDGAAVSVDGDARGAAPFAEQLVVKAGTIQVDVAADGFRSVQRSVVITAGELTRESFELVAEVSSEILEEPEDPEAAVGRGRVLTWIAAGVAVALGVGAGLMWWQANEEHSRLKEECNPAIGCEEGQTSTADTLVGATNVLLVSSLVVGAAAIALFFIEGSAAEEPSAEVGIGPGSVLVRGRF